MLRSLIKKRLDRRGFQVARKIATNGPQLDVLRLLVIYAAETDPDAVIIQVGANDGVRQDPIRSLLHEERIPAICIEPVPYLAEALRANTSDLPHVRVRQHAVAPQAGTLTLYQIVPDHSSAPDWAKGMVSSDRAVILQDRRLRNLGADAIESIEVPALPLTTVVEEERLERILLLQVDVEGFDDVVVGHAIDSGLRPAIIHYEHKHLSLSKQTELRKKLAACDYAMVSWNGEDTLAKLKGLTTP